LIGEERGDWRLARVGSLNGASINWLDLSGSPAKMAIPV
jgi:hypothetical protein